MARSGGRSQAELELEFTGTINNFGNGNLAELRYSNPKAKSTFGCTFYMNAKDIGTEIEKRTKASQQPMIDQYLLALKALNKLTPPAP